MNNLAEIFLFFGSVPTAEMAVNPNTQAEANNRELRGPNGWRKAKGLKLRAKG
jgi:hypothetical protein